MDRQDVSTVQIIRGNALTLPLADDSVDLVVTSPPYFGLRSYQDGGEHYAGQIGDEPTPAEFVDALIAATAEMARVLKPSGSLWVNLGDKYAGSRMDGSNDNGSHGTMATKHRAIPKGQSQPRKASAGAIPTKSLIGIPWRYAIRCIDDLGLILRANVIWSKPNGLPESVTDRVRRSHEDWFHFTLNPRYYSAVDEIREPSGPEKACGPGAMRGPRSIRERGTADPTMNNPLGKLPGSVWTVATEPLHVPDHLGIDHFAAFPTEWPRRIITGWSPREVCTACGEGRRPVAGKAAWWAEYKAEHGIGDYLSGSYTPGEGYDQQAGRQRANNGASIPAGPKTVITGYACACPDTSAPATPGVVLDPFGGTGTTALVAHALGRHGISNDMSSDYCRLAGWRTSDPKQQAKAARREYVPPREQTEGQLDLLEGIA